MSNDTTETGNVTIEGEIDAGWNSYYGDGETVDVPGDGRGEIDTEFWPAEATDKEKLNADQKAVIRMAALQGEQFESVRELSDAAAPEKSESYANWVLRDHYPDALEEIRQAKHDATNQDTDGESGGEADSGGNLETQADGQSGWVPIQEIDTATLERLGVDYEKRTVELVRVIDGDSDE